MEDKPNLRLASHQDLLRPAHLPSASIWRRRPQLLWV